MQIFNNKASAGQHKFSHPTYSQVSRNGHCCGCRLLTIVAIAGHRVDATPRNQTGLKTVVASCHICRVESRTTVWLSVVNPTTFGLVYGWSLAIRISCETGLWVIDQIRLTLLTSYAVQLIV
jgi:hypothetical protein